MSVSQSEHALTLAGVVKATPRLVTLATRAAVSAVGSDTDCGGVMTHVVAIAVTQVVVICRPDHSYVYNYSDSTTIQGR